MNKLVERAIADEDTFPDESEFSRLNKNAVLRHRNQVIEECALLVAERAIWTSDRDIKDVLIAVAAAIRALKDKPHGN